MNGLEQLPARMTALEEQIVQLRDEMHGEFSAVRNEMQAQGEGLRNELRTEMRELNATTLAAIKTGDEETRVFMRTLFEKYVADRPLMDEGRPKRNRK